MGRMILGLLMTDKEYDKVVDFVSENYTDLSWNKIPASKRETIIYQILEESRKKKLREVM